MKNTLITILVTIVVLFAATFIYLSTGAYDISQASHHNAVTKFVIKLTKHSSIEKRMKDNEVPADIKDTALFVSGFKLYNNKCVGCHSAPGEKPDDMAAGLYPKPPELYKHEEEDAAQEFFWIIKNGIKMTSMPAYEPKLNDEQIWALSAFVTQQLGKMKPEDYRAWKNKYSEQNESGHGIKVL